MPEPDCNEFLSLLRKSRLLTAQQLEAVEQRASAGAPPRQLADILTDKGLLTAWQSSQLRKGQTGFVLGKYRLLNPVGRGGMGHVFRARDDRSGQIVAVKVMARKLSTNKILVNRFRREIKAASQLSNPHVVRAVDAGRVGNVDFMVMEYVNGDQLDRIAHRVGDLPVGLACEIVRQAALGLQHAHEKRVVHRDIKPSNLIVDWDRKGRGTVKIMDLGLVRLEEEEPEEAKSVTRTGQVMGTPDYMSPEQAWDTTKADIRSDIYSLGCALFRLITGQVPFPGDNPLQVLMARCSRDIPDIRTICPEVDEGIQTVLARMTRRDPGQRFQTPHEVAAALEPFSTALTRQALREAMRDSQTSGTSTGRGNDGTLSDSSGNAGDDDARYQQFLSEMEAGAAVDLMLSSSASSPDIPQSPAAPGPIVSDPRSYAARSRQRRQQSTPWLWLSVGGVVAIVVIAVALTQIPGGGSGSDNNTGDDVAGDSVPWVLPEAVFAPVPLITVRTGETASRRVAYSITTPGTGGTARVAVSDDAPDGAAFDPATNEVSWTPSTLMTPGRYEFTVCLHWESEDHSVQVASVPVQFLVQPGPLSVALQRPGPQRLPVNRPFELDLAAVAFDAAEVGAEYRITSGAMPAMQLDSTTGVLSWVPDENAVGRHDVAVALVDQASEQVLSDTSVRLIVMPTVVNVQLPDVPVQNAVAGERFALQLPSRQPQMLRGAVRLTLGNGAPPGLTLDAESQTLTWDVPVTQSGRVEFELRAEPAGSEIVFTPDSRSSTRIILDVEAAAVVKTQPPEVDVKAAEDELRTVFRRELSAARSTTSRTQLAVRLLEQSLSQESGASDFALLNLIAEVADRGNAFDVLFEAERLRQERYGTDEIAAMLAPLQRLRRNGQSPLQQDLIVEHCLRLAAQAAEADRFEETAGLLNPAGILLRGAADVSGGRMLVSDVSRAVELAELLAKEEDNGNQPLLGGELRRILSRWQFHDLFTQMETLSFLRNPNSVTPLVDSGRSMWKLDRQQLVMESSPVDGLTGFLETTRKPQRFIVRMRVAPRTNSLSLIIGGNPGADLSGYLITLDNTAFGRIQRLPGPTSVREAPASVPLSGSFPNLVEVIGEGHQITVRLNGTRVYSSRVPEDTAGHVGLMSSLVRPEPGAVVDIRRPRVLILPAED